MTDCSPHAADAAAGNRITQAALEAAVAQEFYFTADQGVSGAAIDAAYPRAVDSKEVQVTIPAALAQITICVLILRNGFKLVGVNEGPVDPAEFDAAKGRQYARQKALDQLWPLLGYELRTKLAAQPPQPRYTVADIQRYEPGMDVLSQRHTMTIWLNNGQRYEWWWLFTDQPGDPLEHMIGLINVGLLQPAA